MDRETSQIQVRYPKFNYADDNPKYWFDNCPIKTYFANGVTASIPYGERFIIACVKPYVEDIKDPQFKQQVKDFLKQEKNHSKAHFHFFKKVVLPHYPNLVFKKSWFFQFTFVLAWLMGKKIRLGMIAGVEHLTAIMGNLFLEHPEFCDGIPPDLFSVWQWHCLEEVEHKAVAFDLLKEFNCGYFTRVFGFLMVTFVLMVGFFTPLLAMAGKDKKLFSLKFYAKLLGYLFYKPGILRRLIIPYFRYLLPFFHPWQMDNKALLETWRIKLQEFEEQYPSFSHLEQIKKDEAY